MECRAPQGQAEEVPIRTPPSVVRAEEFLSVSLSGWLLYVASLWALELIVGGHCKIITYPLYCQTICLRSESLHSRETTPATGPLSSTGPFLVGTVQMTRILLNGPGCVVVVAGRTDEEDLEGIFHTIWLNLARGLLR